MVQVLNLVVVLELALVHGPRLLVLDDRLVPVVLELLEKVLHFGTLEEL